VPAVVVGGAVTVVSTEAEVEVEVSSSPQAAAMSVIATNRVNIRRLMVDPTRGSIRRSIDGMNPPQDL
jgi:hypothetical protein